MPPLVMMGPRDQFRALEVRWKQICPVCESGEIERIPDFSRRDKAPGSRDGHDTMLCTRCGLRVTRSYSDYRFELQPTKSGTQYAQFEIGVRYRTNFPEDAEEASAETEPAGHPAHCWQTGECVCAGVTA